MLFAVASTVDRAKNQMVLKKELNIQVLQNYTLKTLQMSFVMTTLYLVYRQMQFMKINIYLVLLWLDLVLLRNQLKLQEKKMLQQFVMVLQEKVMTRFVSNLELRLLLLTLRLSLLGEMTNGTWTQEKLKLNIVRLMELIFHLVQTRATAVTETYGTLVMKDQNQKILQTNQTMNIF